jgi:hypothetical protein
VLIGRSQIFCKNKKDKLPISLKRLKFKKISVAAIFFPRIHEFLGLWDYLFVVQGLSNPVGSKLFQTYDVEKNLAGRIGLIPH